MRQADRTPTEAETVETLLQDIKTLEQKDAQFTDQINQMHHQYVFIYVLLLLVAVNVNSPVTVVVNCDNMSNVYVCNSVLQFRLKIKKKIILHVTN
jgi:hypothetical protein